ALGVLFFAASSLLREVGYLPRFLAGAGGALLLVTSPLFLYTSGLAWNHDLPVLLTMLAIVTYFHGMGQVRSAKGMVASGVLLGLAVGTRLSFALVLVPFAGALLLMPGVSSLRSKLGLLGA